MLNCNKVERERGCIKAISIMQKLGCALIMQGEWWIQGLFQVLLILSLLLSGEWLCSVVVFSDQRISGLCGTSASIVCFFSPSLSPPVCELPIKCFLVFRSYQVYLVLLAWHLSSALWLLSISFYAFLISSTSLGGCPSVCPLDSPFCFSSFTLWTRGTSPDGACILPRRMCSEHKTHRSFVFKENHLPILMKKTKMVFSL